MTINYVSLGSARGTLVTDVYFGIEYIAYFVNMPDCFTQLSI